MVLSEKTTELCNKKLRYYGKKLWNYTENYGPLIYYGKNYGTIEKKLWYYGKDYDIMLKAMELWLTME